MHMHRREDQRLLTGRGCFTDDIEAPEALVAVFVRSPHAHAAIRRIGVEVAMAVPGALLVLTGADLAAAGISPIAITPRLVDLDGKPPKSAPWPILANAIVRHVGEPVVLCVGDTATAARAMAEAILVDYERLPVAADLDRARTDGAPMLHGSAPGNLAFHWELGDKAGTAAAFAKADHVVEVRRTSQRVIICPMEPRAAVARYETANGLFHLATGNQAMTLMRDQAAQCLGIDKHRLVVTSGDVGGAFGIRNGVYPEYPALLQAARVLGRPVRWTSTRSEAFQSDAQARDSRMLGRLALDKTGRFLAIEISAEAAMGAYLQQVGYFIACANFARCIAGPYRIPVQHVAVDCVFTNTVPTAPYRGAGRPEAALIMESLVEAAAQQLELDSIELRRRNMIQREEMPFRTAAGTVYDSGDFPATLDAVLKAADWPAAPARKAEARSRGRLRGIGLASFVEISGGVPNERAQMTLRNDGSIFVRTPVGATGQGHETVFAIMAAEQLQISPDRIVVGQGDSTGFEDGGSSSASRSTTMAGLAIRAAAHALIAKARSHAADRLGVAPDALDYKDGHFAAPGTNLAIGLDDLVKLGETIFVDEKIEALPTFPNGCHVAEVEIDPETGAVTLAAYFAVDDCGRVISHEFAEGQIYGALAQGIGQALMELGHYDPDSGQLVAGSFMDYAVPRAIDMPPINSALRPEPARSNPLGVKGVGESGTVGALPAVMNAVLDALRPLGVTDIEMPITAERVWRAIHAARKVTTR